MFGVDTVCACVCDMVLRLESNLLVLRGVSVSSRCNVVGEPAVCTWCVVVRNSAGVTSLVSSEDGD